MDKLGSSTLPCLVFAYWKPIACASRFKIQVFKNGANSVLLWLDLKGYQLALFKLYSFTVVFLRVFLLNVPLHCRLFHWCSSTSKIAQTILLGNLYAKSQAFEGSLWLAGLFVSRSDSQQKVVFGARAPIIRHICLLFSSNVTSCETVLLVNQIWFWLKLFLVCCDSGFVQKLALIFGFALLIFFSSNTKLFGPCRFKPAHV
jgi:hypothetical protein